MNYFISEETTKISVEFQSMEEKIHCYRNVKTSCVSNCQSEASVGFVVNTIVAAYMLLVAIVPITNLIAKILLFTICFLFFLLLDKDFA